MEAINKAAVYKLHSRHADLYRLLSVLAIRLVHPKALVPGQVGLS